MATEGSDVWLKGGDVGEFDQDGRNDLAFLHKVSDDPEDSAWKVEVVFSKAVSPTPIDSSPTQLTWSAVFNWVKNVTSTEYDFLDWGVGDSNTMGMTQTAHDHYRGPAGSVPSRSIGGWLATHAKRDHWRSAS